MNRFISLWGCPSTLLSDNGLQFCSQLTTGVYKLLGIHKLTTSAYHPSGSGGVERVNHSMAQMLAMVCNEPHNDWDVHLPHVEYAYNNSVSAATGLAPNEVYIGRLPRLPLAIFNRPYGGVHQSPKTATTRLRARAGTARSHSRSCKRKKLYPFGRASSPPQIRGRRLGMGIQHRRHHTARTAQMRR